MAAYRCCVMHVEPLPDAVEAVRIFNDVDHRRKIDRVVPHAVVPRATAVASYICSPRRFISVIATSTKKDVHLRHGDSDAGELTQKACTGCRERRKAIDRHVDPITG